MEEQAEPPDALKNRVELFEDLVPVWDAFWFLSGSRTENGTIPVSEMVAYLRDVRGEKDKDALQEKVTLIRAIDLKFLELTRQENDGP